MRSVIIMSFLILLTACSKPEPIELGFLGNLSGRTNFVDTEARNGMSLAVEHWNSRGGIHKQPISIRIADAKQDDEALVEAVNSLIEAGVDAIIGPSLSAQAVIVAPIVENAKIPTFGSTVTTDALSNINDHFFRPVSSLKLTTKSIADVLFGTLQPKSFGIAIDTSNKTFTQNWQLNFAGAMADLGVRQIYRGSFESGDNIALLDTSLQLARLDTDLIVLITNATDAALMIKQIRTVNPDVSILISEWAGLRQLIQLAGKDAEGVWVPRYIDENNTAPAFVELQQQFEQRFGMPIGQPGLAAYVSTNTVLQALANKADKQTVKDYLLETSIFDAVINEVELNQYGDEVNTSLHFLSRIENGQFVTVK